VKKTHFTRLIIVNDLENIFVNYLLRMVEKFIRNYQIYDLMIWTIREYLVDLKQTRSCRLFLDSIIFLKEAGW
jgi:hypothetical protein